MLRLSDVDAFYGKSQALRAVSLEVGAGETVALLGRNGAGKTTTLKAVMGLVARRGRVVLDGDSLSSCPPFEIVRRGVAYVPEHRGVFGKLTVQENLQIAVRRGAGWTVTDMLERFPGLARRRRVLGDRLSGGEQQMLAISRALLAGPRVVLLDEPSEGLAPVIVADVAEVIREMQQRGLAIMLVEQRIELCLQLAQRVYVIDSGELAYSGTTDDFRAAAGVRDRHLGLRDA